MLKGNSLLPVLGFNSRHCLKCYIEVIGDMHMLNITYKANNLTSCAYCANCKFHTGLQLCIQEHQTNLGVRNNGLHKHTLWLEKKLSNIFYIFSFRFLGSSRLFLDLISTKQFYDAVYRNHFCIEEQTWIVF